MCKYSEPMSDSYPLHDLKKTEKLLKRPYANTHSHPIESMLSLFEALCRGTHTHTHIHMDACLHKCIEEIEENLWKDVRGNPMYFNEL